MQRRQAASAFVQRAIAAGWLGGTELRLLDVGASGGIDAFWNQFRRHLRALGLDPLEAEVQRLNAAEADPKVRYAAGWVGAGRPVPSVGWGDMMHGRSSAHRAERVRGADYKRDVFNTGVMLAFSDRQLTVDGLVAGGSAPDPDVVKIDVDFFEGFVLDGAARSLAEGRVVLVECECGFHELADRSRSDGPWRAFADVDLAMRRAGYRLLDLEPWRYTRGTLPGRFLYETPAQTDGGQVSFCDAVWFLDPSVDKASLDRLRADPPKLAKLVLLLESFGYPDVAAAVLLRLIDAGAVPPGMDARAALDWLVPPNPFGATGHAAYLAAFDHDPRRFLPSGWAAAEAEQKVRRMTPVPGALARAAWVPAYQGARVRAEGGATRIVTAPLAWSYAAALPIDAAALAGDSFIVEITVEARSGAAYVTLATPDHAEIGEQLRVEPGGAVLRLQGSRAAGRTYILLRNAERAEATDLLVTAVRCLQ